MKRRLFAFSRNTIILITIAAISGCSLFRGPREVPDFDHSDLRRGYLVIVHTQANEVIKFKIYMVDSEYIYGKRGSPKIKISDINKLEVFRTNPAIVTGFVITVAVAAIALINYVVLNGGSIP